MLTTRSFIKEIIHDLDVSKKSQTQKALTIKKNTDTLNQLKLIIPTHQRY